MSLSVEQLKVLQRPFRYAEHEFKPPHGFVYVAEAAITARIEEVDPSWELRLLNVFTRGQMTHAVISLTICGVTREGIGTQVIELTKDGSRESNEAEKSAATDALRRASRLFGMGRYLLKCPVKIAMDKFGNITDRSTVDQFATWLAEQQRAAGMIPPKTDGSGPVVPVKPEALALSAPETTEETTPVADEIPGITPRPAVKGRKWTQAEQAAWWKLHNEEEGHARSDLLAALGVDGLSKFAGSKQSADEMLAWYIDAQLARVSF